MQPESMVSVALCTYNGAAFLKEQLDSIGQQTRLPDELVIVDDHSQDQTLAIISAFSQSVSFPVRLLRNEINLGSTKSFERAVRACTGAIIVFSDQDDVWRADRLAVTEAYFQANPAMNAVFSDAELIGGDGSLLNRRIWDEVQFTGEVRKQWANKGHQLLFFGYVVTGATLAIRHSLLPLLLPFPTHVPQLIHDAWIALITALHGTIGFIDEPLIYYRRHEQQQVGFKPLRPKVTLKDRWTRGREGKLIHVLQQADRYQQLYQLLNSRPGIDPGKLQLLNRMQTHLTRRSTLSPRRLLRLGPVLREVSRGNYHLFGGRWWLTILGDLFEA